MKTLKEMREKKGLTQVAVAKEIGVVSSLVRMWETGDRSPLIHADKLANIYEVDIGEIFLAVNNTKKAKIINVNTLTNKNKDDNINLT